MSNYDFKKDFPIAKETEKEIANLLIEKYGTKILSYNDDYRYDLLVEAKSKKIKLEIKEDFTGENYPDYFEHERIKYKNDTDWGFTPWGFAMLGDTWKDIFRGKTIEEIQNRHDTIIGYYMKENPDRFCTRPPLSHIALIDAAEGATHTPSQEWFEEHEKTWIHRGML